jgi:hypothetical protein
MVAMNQIEPHKVKLPFTFMSSTNDGNPPIDMKVKNPTTKDKQAPLP